MEAFDVVRAFEVKVAQYTGAPYCVAVNSCTAALFLCFLWEKNHLSKSISMPAKTYPSVPMSAHHAGLEVEYRDEKWSGSYIMYTEPVLHHIWDCAKRFTSEMFVANTMMCLSFHARKMLPIGSGGAILHDNPHADEWFRRMRFDGRKEGVPTKDDTYSEPGYHCYMLPEQAARGLHLMTWYPKTMPDQAMDDYPDMSKFQWRNDARNT